MADASARILDMVRRELEKNRDVPTEDLFQKAVRIDSSISKLSPRQFHAKYPLQIKRAMKRGGRRQKSAAAPVGRPRSTGGRKGARKGARRGRPPKTDRAATSSVPAPANGGGRDEVRGLLMRFAKVVVAADGKAAMVDVLSEIDGWVDRMVAAAKG